MNKQETLDKYWNEFLDWAETEKFFADDDDFFELVSVNLRTRPTEENFWLWYQENKKQ